MSVYEGAEFTVGNAEYPADKRMFTERTREYLFAGAANEWDMIEAMGGRNMAKFMNVTFSNVSVLGPGVTNAGMASYMDDGTPARARMAPDSTIADHDTMILHAAAAASAVSRLQLIASFVRKFEPLASAFRTAFNQANVIGQAGNATPRLSPRDLFISRCDKLRERMCAKIGAVLAHTIFTPFDETVLDNSIPDSPEWSLLLGSQHAQYQIMYEKYLADLSKALMKNKASEVPVGRIVLASAIKIFNADAATAQLYGVTANDDQTPTLNKLLNRAARRLRSMISRHALATIGASRSKSTKPAGGWVRASGVQRVNPRKADVWGHARGKSRFQRANKAYDSRRIFDEPLFAQVRDMRNPTRGRSSYLFRQTYQQQPANAPGDGWEEPRDAWEDPRDADDRWAAEVEAAEDVEQQYLEPRTQRLEAVEQQYLKPRTQRLAPMSTSKWNARAFAGARRARPTAVKQPSNNKNRVLAALKEAARKRQAQRVL